MQASRSRKGPEVLANYAFLRPLTGTGSPTTGSPTTGSPTTGEPVFCRAPCLTNHLLRATTLCRNHVTGGGSSHGKQHEGTADAGGGVAVGGVFLGDDRQGGAAVGRDGAGLADALCRPLAGFLR